MKGRKRYRLELLKEAQRKAAGVIMTTDGRKITAKGLTPPRRLPDRANPYRDGARSSPLALALRARRQ